MIGYKKPLGSAMMGHKMALGKNMLGSKIPLLMRPAMRKVVEDLTRKVSGGLERRILKR